MLKSPFKIRGGAQVQRLLSVLGRSLSVMLEQGYI